MNNLSPKQLVRLWTELMQCYYNDNRYGGRVAEIYAYTLLPANPLAETGVETELSKRRELELAREAGRALLEVCQLFEDENEVLIEVEGDVLPIWNGRPFNHRVHVRVVDPHQ